MYTAFVGSILYVYYWLCCVVWLLLLTCLGSGLVFVCMLVVCVFIGVLLNIVFIFFICVFLYGI